MPAVFSNNKGFWLVLSEKAFTIGSGMQIIAGSCGKYTAVNSIFSAEKLPRVLKIWNNGFLENPLVNF